MVVELKQRTIVATHPTLHTPGATTTSNTTGSIANWTTSVRIKVPGTENKQYYIVAPCKVVPPVLE